MKLNITETRKIARADLINLCVKNDWYTRGNCKSYDMMLNMTDGEITNTLMYLMACDIIEHSDPKCFADCEPNGIRPVEHVMFEMNEISHTTFTVTED